VSDASRTQIEAEILAWMRERPWREDATRFERLARALFAFQFHSCPAYARFCSGRGVTPAVAGSWRDVPAVPTGAFKELRLACFPASQTCKIFRTSGTSGAHGERRGELHLDRLDLYEASALASLRHLLFPDLVAEGARTTIRVLAPAPAEAPDSSLSHMFGCLLATLGSAESGYDVSGETLRLDSLLERLSSASRRSEPVALCGTAFAFVHLLDAMAARSLSLALPAGSRVMETGGFKGRSRELPREDLYAALSLRLGVPERRIVNQYGMTELGSQFYDSVLVDPDGPRRKLAPPWVRVAIVDPETGCETEPGRVGMLVVFDLANTGSVAAVQTADLGRRVLSREGAAMGFEVLGRAAGAEARGCSIAADAMLMGGT